MKKVVCIFLIFMSSQLFAQQTSKKFSTQGEHETYLITQIFDSNYTQRVYPHYRGKIVQINNDIFQFGNKIIKIINTDSNMILFFKNGIFNPNYLWASDKNVHIKISKEIPLNQSPPIRLDTILISNFEEIKYAEKNEKSKRFRFLLFPNTMNPILYIVEFTNDNGYKYQSFSDFFKKANMTFIKPVSTLL